MTESIPLTDSHSLRPKIRRTRIVRLTVAAALILGGVTCVLLTRSPGGSLPLVVPGTQTIVVLDVSGSVELNKLRLAYRTLELLGNSKARVGLIVFSGYAYESLPPDSPAADLLPVASLFKAGHASQNAYGVLPPNPWTAGFANGTEISSGLALARSVIARNHLHRPSVVLISDLFDDSADLAHVSAEGKLYRHLGIPVRIVPLDPTAGDLRYVLKAIGSSSSAVQPRFPQNDRFLTRSSFPTALAAVSIAIAVLLALTEIALAPLRWRAPSSIDQSPA